MLDVNKYLKQVDCHFIYGEKPYKSASSPDKERYHVFDTVKDGYLLFDTIDEIKNFIAVKHIMIAAKLAEEKWE